MTRRFCGLMAVLALAGGAPAVAAQNAGSIVGRVTDAATQQPVVSAQVFVVGSTRGALTNEDGRYRVSNAPAGSQQVRVLRVGYTAAVQTVTVPAQGEATLDFALSAAPSVLDSVVVTVTGATRRREIANAVSNIDAANIVDEAPVANLSELLNGRATGVNVLQSSGTVGTGARIRIRGSNSVSLPNDPIIFVDGARVYSASSAFSIFTGGQAPSRIDDINPDDIESIEIVKGPSAATLYGTDAANGVIVVTTKRGRSGAARWNAFASGGVITDRHKGEYPLNYRGSTGTTITAPPCFVFMLSAGLCQQQTLFSYQPLNDPVVSPIADGTHQQYGLSVSGGGDLLTYYFSADWLDQVGTFELPDSIRTAVAATGALAPWQTHPSDLRQVNLRGNFGAQLGGGFGLSLSSGYVSSNTHLPQNDDALAGIIPSGLEGAASPDLGTHGYGLLPPDQVFVIETLQELDRYTASLQGTWQSPSLHWLSARASGGLDITHRHDSQFFPVDGVTFFGPVTASGGRVSNRILVQSWTGDVSATASFDLTPEISSRTSLGMQYYRNHFRATAGQGQGLTPGTKSVSAASVQFAAEQTTETATTGLFAEQRFGWRDRLYVTGGLRADDNSAFGQDFDVTYYPKLGASFVAVDADSDPLFGVLSSLQLRAAWGASGVAPGATNAVRFFTASSASIAGIDEPGVTFGAVGNFDLKPERSSEIEAGFDARLLNERVGLEFTYYRKETEDALIQRVLAPSLGAGASRFENIGSVLNEGIEASVDAQLLDLRNVKLDVRVSGSHNNNELLELGEGVSPILLLFGRQRHVEGYPLGGYWERPLTFNDANSDGLITANELTLGDTAQFLGNVFPANQVSISSSVTLFDRLRVNVLFDHHGDYLQYNFEEEIRCQLSICRGLNDPNAPLFEQARAVNSVALGAGRTAAPYMEDASFWKLRELSFTVMAPQRWAQAIGARRLDLTVTGRNLATWTDYSGLDPEVSAIGQQSNFIQVALFTLPPVRTWLARVNVGF